jgi:hypothetical protein
VFYTALKCIKQVFKLIKSLNTLYKEIIVRRLSQAKVLKKIAFKTGRPADSFVYLFTTNPFFDVYLFVCLFFTDAPAHEIVKPLTYKTVNTELNFCPASITYRFPSSVSSRGIHAKSSHMRRLFLIPSSFLRLHERLKLNSRIFLQRYWLEWKLHPFNFVSETIFWILFIAKPSKHRKELQVYNPYFSQRMSAMTI